MPDTIFALSSGQPPAAIAIVRISGSAARDALVAICATIPPPRLAQLRTLRCPEQGDVLDTALVLWFPGPATATGEDLAELHLHGGRAVVAAVLAALERLPDLRAAEAGEFTRRALENGRIDLIEAEGLADLLSAETDAQRRNALTMALGHLSQAISRWQDQILRLSAQIEAELDFGDEDDVADHGQSHAKLVGAAESIGREIGIWLDRPVAERLRDGVSVVIAGPPNAGKSTLFNALIQRDAAIISPFAGTTRDIIDVSVAIQGVAFRFLDTAGLRDDGNDAIEAIGIKRAGIALQSADIVLWLGDPLHFPAHANVVRVAAQSDIFSGTVAWDTRIARSDIAVSAQIGDGMAQLLSILVKLAQQILPASGEVALNHRQHAILTDVSALLAQDSTDRAQDLLLVAERLRLARAALDRLTGKAGTENMLDALFGRFCIGK